MIDLMQGDCLELMKRIPDGSVDMALADLPYVITAAGWDSIIPFDKLLTEYKRICKKDAAIVLFGSQPFTTKMISSNMKAFKQALVWAKGKGSNPLLANKRIMSAHEDILIFCYGKLPYNPQFSEGASYKASRTGSAKRTNRLVNSAADKEGWKQADNPGRRFPISVLSYSISCGFKKHPAEKPVDLLRYLIRTYSNEGDVILDNTMGSGSTGVAAKLEKRSFIGIELDQGYFDVARNRINDAGVL